MSSTLVLLLLVVSTFAHALAHVRTDTARRQFAIMDDRTLRQMGVTDFIHAHYWVAVAYGGVFLASLLWLEF